MESTQTSSNSFHTAPEVTPKMEDEMKKTMPTAPQVNMTLDIPQRPLPQDFLNQEYFNPDTLLAQLHAVALEGYYHDGSFAEPSSVILFTAWFPHSANLSDLWETLVPMKLERCVIHAFQASSSRFYVLMPHWTITLLHLGIKQHRERANFDIMNKLPAVEVDQYFVFPSLQPKCYEGGTFAPPKQVLEHFNDILNDLEKHWTHSENQKTAYMFYTALKVYGYVSAVQSCSRRLLP